MENVHASPFSRQIFALCQWVKPDELVKAPAERRGGGGFRWVRASISTKQK